MQCNLRPTAQCAEAAQRANAVLVQILRSFHYRDRHAYPKLYICILSAAPAWSPWTRRDIDLLESNKQRAVRMISGLQVTSYDMVQVYKSVQDCTWF